MPAAETEIFQLVIPSRDQAAVLLSDNHENYSLPQIEVPRCQRIAEHLTMRAKELWNLQALCLFNPAWKDKPSCNPERNYQVLELRDPDWLPPADFKWVARTSLHQDARLPPEDRHALGACLRLADEYNRGTRPGPFAKAGWLDELIAWMQPHVSVRGLALNGKYQQFNASPFFSLIRLETDGPAVWFKAVGEPNLREYTITTTLAQERPTYLPRIIANREDWHGWLMEEATGATHLNKVLELKRWQQAAGSLASLQVDCVGNATGLLRADCKDCRVPQIVGQIDPFLAVMAELMEEEPSSPPPRITREELDGLGDKLREACCRLETVGIPDTIGHCDFNPGNILSGSTHCVFIDWAEAYVGCPFVTLEYLLAHLRKSHPELNSWEESIRRAYKEKWESLISSADISEAFRFTPLIAVLTYALARDGWRDPHRGPDLPFAKLMRSLVRRMWREAEKLNSSEAPCVTG